MNIKLKKELDLISEKHQDIIKTAFIKTNIKQTIESFKREDEAFAINLIKKSNDFNLVNDKETEIYIKKLLDYSEETFNNLLNS